MNRIFSQVCIQVAGLLGKPYVFIFNVILVVIMTLLCFKYPDGPLTLAFNTFLSVSSYLFLFLLQNTQNRDNTVLHVKLNELIHSIDKANDKLIGIETQTVEEIQEIEKNIKEEIVDKDKICQEMKN